VVVGVVVAAAIFVTVGPPAASLQRVTACELGAEVGTYTIWTPFLLIDIPDGGNVTYAANEGNITVVSGSLTLNDLRPQGGPIATGESGGSGLNRAGIYAEYADRNWTIHRVSNVSTEGGTSGPCTQPYVAQVGWPGSGCGGDAIIPIPDNTSDATAPNRWNGEPGFNGSEKWPGCPQQSPGTYATFDSALHLGGPGPGSPTNWNLCGVTGYERLTLVGIASVPLTLNVPYDGALVTVSATLRWVDSSVLPAYMGGPTTGYLVPGGWNWTLAPIGPVLTGLDPRNPLPGLVAFERSAC
jgi:hypothetical protein